MALIEQQAGWSPPAVEPQLEGAHRDVYRRLLERYEGRVDRAVVREIVTRCFAALADARITLYVPMLVERNADDELRLRLERRP